MEKGDRKIQSKEREQWGSRDSRKICWVATYVVLARESAVQDGFVQMSNQLCWRWKWSLRTIPSPALAPGIGQGLIPSCLWDVICVSGFPCQQSFLTWVPMSPDDSSAPMAAHSFNLFKEICQSRDGVGTGGWEGLENPSTLASGAYSQTLPVTEGSLSTQNYLSQKHWIVAFSQHSNKQVKEGVPNHRASTSRSEGGACIKDSWGLSFSCDMWLL